RPRRIARRWHGEIARAEEALRQQRLAARAAERSVAVPSERRARARLHDGSPPRLPHAVRSAGEDQLRQARRDRTAHPPGELGECERRLAAEFEVIDEEDRQRRGRDSDLLLSRQIDRPPSWRRVAPYRSEDSWL